MFVCVCRAVTDTKVRQAIDAGAATRLDVTRACGAGGDCGACHEHIEGMIEDRRADQTDPAMVAACALVRTRAA